MVPDTTKEGRRRRPSLVWRWVARTVSGPCLADGLRILGAGPAGTTHVGLVPVGIGQVGAVGVGLALGGRDPVVELLEDVADRRDREGRLEVGAFAVVHR